MFHGKEHPTLQQNTNHKLGAKLDSDLRERRGDTDNTFEMKRNKSSSGAQVNDTN